MNFSGSQEPSQEREGIQLMREFLENEGLRIVHTKTDPSYVFAMEDVRTAKCKSGPSMMVDAAGFFAPVETKLFRTILKEQCKQVNENGQPPLVLDVGANMGYFTLYAAKMGCRVIAFEPLPRLVNFIRMNLELNHLTDRVLIVEGAVSDKEGTAYIDAVCSELGFSHVTESNSGNQISSKKVTISDSVKEDVLLLKIDVEGYEDFVFKGLEEFLKEYELKNIICETKNTGDVQYKRKVINDFLAKKYDVFSYAENYFYSEQENPISLAANIAESALIPLSTLSESNWIPYEDLFYTKQKGELLFD
eukprot:TRINITY_DN3594_c0_g1_i1.p1 TRINITY_DN3594_c0_g1~~TRINITY_DN3594_c0_g1_i1.p1  ORF type:complete len:341 (-),score=70.30 TRINITY_DN3594_c0_g1_i1:150-1067(-)